MFGEDASAENLPFARTGDGVVEQIRGLVAVRRIAIKAHVELVLVDKDLPAPLPTRALCQGMGEQHEMHAAQHRGIQGEVLVGPGGQDEAEGLAVAADLGGGARVGGGRPSITASASSNSTACPSMLLGAGGVAPAPAHVSAPIPTIVRSRASAQLPSLSPSLLQRRQPPPGPVQPPPCPTPPSDPASAPDPSALPQQTGRFNRWTQHRAVGARVVAR